LQKLGIRNVATIKQRRAMVNEAQSIGDIVHPFPTFAAAYHCVRG